MTRRLPLVRPGTATILVARNPLNRDDVARHSVPAGTLIIDFLQDDAPDGYGRPIRLILNGTELAIVDSDLALRDGDVLHVLAQPGGPGIGAAILTQVIIAVATAVALIVVNAIFGRKPRGSETPAADPIYSISGAQNAARLGEPIPVLYGDVITTPDFASQPYVFYNGNEQYLDQILVIGQGLYRLNGVLVGESLASSLAAGVVQSWLIEPATHGSTMGNIEALTGIMENVVSSPEVGDQELPGSIGGEGGAHGFGCTISGTAPNKLTCTGDIPPSPLPSNRFTLSGQSPAGPNNGKTFNVSSYVGGVITTVENTVVTDSGRATWISFQVPTNDVIAGPFTTSNPGVTGNRIMVDFVFPQGLYGISNSGDLLIQQVVLEVTMQPINDAGANAGAAIVQTFTYTEADNTPVRRTETINVPAARYSVKVVRKTPPAPDTQTVNNVVWTSLKFRLVNVAGPIYGAVTLLAIRIRATNGIAANASSRIRADVSRKLPPLGVGAAVVTNNPADAFTDVMINTVYGAKRPLSEVDTAELARLKTHWNGETAFNGAFATKTTIWEALAAVLQTSAAAPLPLGQLMSVGQDGVKALRTQLFSDANIVEGTLKLGYTFDKPGEYDGFQVEYRDRKTWNPAFEVYPAGALDPQSVNLFGCTSQTTAAGFAKFLWQQQLGRRKTAEFSTEAEGLLPRRGDRVAVSSSLPRWGQSGVVVGVAGLELLLDADLDWTGGPHVIVLRSEVGKPSNPIAVTRGATDAHVMLGAAPPFDLFTPGIQEPTHYAFGELETVVADFTVQAIEPGDGPIVQIQASNYDPAIFAGTLPWLARAF